MYRRAGTGTKKTAAEVLLDTSRYLAMTSFPERLQAATSNNHTKCKKGEEVEWHLNFHNCFPGLAL
jgi:hypothetical protein